MRHWLFFLFSIFVLGSCNCPTGKNLKASKSTTVLTEFLRELSGNYTLLGHQDDLAYGVGWNSIPGESDIKRVTGSYPAVLGWDIGNIEAENIGGISIDSLRAYILKAFSMGAINTVSWHANNPVTGENSWCKDTSLVASILPGGKNQKLFDQKLDKVASFFLSLKTETGESVPVIFRPFHEMNGDWFWWGAGNCTTAQYISLFRYTIRYLAKKGVDNILVAYSPDRMFSSAEEYLKYYPGDDIVDILGLDDYWDFKIDRLDQVVVKLSMVASLAEKKNKLCAFTETGCDMVQEDKWFTRKLLQVLKANGETRKMVYVLLWRNANTSHFFVPYLGHPQSSDFLKFVAEDQILLLDEMNALK